MIRLIDDQIKRLIESLKASGQFENTIFVVLSDHGDYWGEYGLIRKGAGLSESLARIPMVWAGYHVKNQSAPMDSHVSIADIFPTLCSAIGAKIPAGVQGRSLWPMLTGKRIPQRRVFQHCRTTRFWRSTCRTGFFSYFRTGRGIDAG